MEKIRSCLPSGSRYPCTILFVFECALLLFFKDLSHLAAVRTSQPSHRPLTAFIVLCVCDPQAEYLNSLPLISFWDTCLLLAASSTDGGSYWLCQTMSVVAGYCDVEASPFCSPQSLGEQQKPFSAQLFLLAPGKKTEYIPGPEAVGIHVPCWSSRILLMSRCSVP